jgi:hypothetical protein
MIVFDGNPEARNPNIANYTSFSRREFASGLFGHID